MEEELIDPDTGDVEKKGDYLVDLASNSIEFSNQGHEKIEEAGLDRYILEKYIRIKTQQ